jgi:hypothetical protein
MIFAYWRKIENMSAIIESNSERPPAPACDQAEADRRAECAERISRLLSALGGGPSIEPGQTANPPKPAIREAQTSPESETSRRFLLVDRTGPIGEFGSWEEARQYRNELQQHGASIIEKPLESGVVLEQPANQPAAITGGCNPPNPGTTQELKKADDPGSSQPNSPRQVAALPANSTVMRVMGKIFPAVARTVTFTANPQVLTHRSELLVVGNSGTQITDLAGFGNRTMTNGPQAAGCEAISIHFTAEPNVSHRICVKLNQTAPTSLKPTPPGGAVLEWLNSGTGLRYVAHTQTS